MIGALVGFDVSAGLAVAGVLGYRAFQYWLPIIPGVLAYLRLLRTVRGWEGTDEEGDRPRVGRGWSARSDDGRRRPNHVRRLVAHPERRITRSAARGVDACGFP
jgi:hypothetical protein